MDHGANRGEFVSSLLLTSGKSAKGYAENLKFIGGEDRGMRSCARERTEWEPGGGFGRRRSEGHTGNRDFPPDAKSRL